MLDGERENVFLIDNKSKLKKYDFEHVLWKTIQRVIHHRLTFSFEWYKIYSRYNKFYNLNKLFHFISTDIFKES